MLDVGCGMFEFRIADFGFRISDSACLAAVKFLVLIVFARQIGIAECLNFSDF
jgi:hypothetical protein